MNKILLAMYIFFMIFNIYAADYNKFYYSIDPIVTEVDIIEFFSFYCSHCYKFHNIYNKIIKKNLPKNIKIIEYHVSFLGGEIGPILTQAWSVATILGIEKKIKSILFDIIQNSNNIKDLNDLKNVFNKFAGINSKKYEYFCNNILVKSFLIQQEKTFVQTKSNSIPTILIKGKYIVNINAIDHSSTKLFVEQYLKIVHFLLNKK